MNSEQRLVLYRENITMFLTVERKREIMTLTA